MYSEIQYMYSDIPSMHSDMSEISRPCIQISSIQIPSTSTSNHVIMSLNSQCCIFIHWPSPSIWSLSPVHIHISCNSFRYPWNSNLFRYPWNSLRYPSNSFRYSANSFRCPAIYSDILQINSDILQFIQISCLIF